MSEYSVVLLEFVCVSENRSTNPFDKLNPQTKTKLAKNIQIRCFPSEMARKEKVAAHQILSQYRILLWVPFFSCILVPRSFWSYTSVQREYVVDTHKRRNFGF
mmetsp:Transcript_15021/g.17276  ORF Transcript_15021/g.17276 Transcript_15021/m.17276 type:complete len:103 (-) Transcript_15021:20-328(-)